MYRLLRKSACPFKQVQTKMHLPVSLFSPRNSLAGASGQVLMMVPVISIIYTNHIFIMIPITFMGPSKSIVIIIINN